MNQDNNKITLAVHGINFSNFCTVIAAGGFAAPSLGIISTDKNRRESNDVFRFSAGSILVGFDPSILFNGKNTDPDTTIYDSDFYSVRAPTERVVLSKSFLNKIEKDAIKLDSPFLDEIHRKLNLSKTDRNWHDHLEGFMNSKLMQHLFLNQMGIEFVASFKSNKPQKQSLEAFITRNKFSIDPNLPSSEIIKQQKIIYHKYIDEQYAYHIDSGMSEDDAEYLRDSSKQDANHIVSTLFNRATSKIASFKRSPYIIDTDKTNKRFNALMKKNNADYLNWLVNTIRLNSTSNYYLTDDNQKLKNLNSAVTYMKRNKGIGKEMPISFSSGQLISCYASKISSLSDLLDRKRHLCSLSEYNEDSDLEKAIFDLNWFVSSKITDKQDSNLDQIEIAKNLALRLTSQDSDISVLPKHYGLDSLSFGDLAELTTIGESLKKCLVRALQKKPYFEAVINRAVSLDEVRFVAVPKGQEKAIKTLLKNNNAEHIIVKTYDLNDPSSQLKNFPAKMSIENHSTKILKQRKALTKNCI